jgi:hypothetical protein
MSHQSLLFVLVVGLSACSGSGDQLSADFSRAWSAPPVDSITIDVLRSSDVAAGEEITALNIDSMLGFRLTAAPYRIRIVEDGFVALLVDSGRIVRFDSLGTMMSDARLVAVSEPRSAGICVRGDSALIVDGAGRYNQPRRLVWLALLPDAHDVVPDSMTVDLPVGTLDAGCLAMGSRWALRLTIPEVPGDLTSRLTVRLVAAAPESGVGDVPLFVLADRSEQMRDNNDRPLMQPSPWATPPLIAADGIGRLFVVDGPSGVVRIVDTSAIGAKIRGITPAGRVLTRTTIDSVAAAWRDREAAAAARRGPPTSDDLAIMDQVAEAIRGVTPGGPVPEVDRILVAPDGSFALAASEWLAPGANRWDLFDSEGAYLGALRLPLTARGVGVQGGTLWYVDVGEEGVGRPPRLIRARPARPPAPPS